LVIGQLSKGERTPGRQCRAQRFELTRGLKQGDKEKKFKIRNKKKLGKKTII
jgi:hypothetical protein